MSGLEQEVAELERRRCASLAALDAHALGETLADDYLHCHATGVVHAKDELIRHSMAKPRRIEPRKPAIQILGDVAVLTGPMVNVTSDAGGELTRTRLYVTQVARREPDGWRFVCFQATRMATD